MTQSLLINLNLHFSPQLQPKMSHHLFVKSHFRAFPGHACGDVSTGCNGVKLATQPDVISERMKVFKGDHAKRNGVGVRGVGHVTCPSTVPSKCYYQ